MNRRGNLTYLRQSFILIPYDVVRHLGRGMLHADMKSTWLELQIRCDLVLSRSLLYETNAVDEAGDRGLWVHYVRSEKEFTEVSLHGGKTVRTQVTKIDHWCSILNYLSIDVPFRRTRKMQGWSICQGSGLRPNKTRSTPSTHRPGDILN